MKFINWLLKRKRARIYKKADELHWIANSLEDDVRKLRTEAKELMALAAKLPESLP